MKKLFDFIKIFLLFIFTFLIVLFIFISSAIYYALNSEDNDKNTTTKSFYIANASNEMFNVKIRANDLVILDKTLGLSSAYCFEWELEGAITYEIACSIGDSPQERIYRYDYSHGTNFYYIMANSKDEFVFEAIYLKMEDF